MITYALVVIWAGVTGLIVATRGSGPERLAQPDTRIESSQRLFRAYDRRYQNYVRMLTQLDHIYAMQVALLGVAALLAVKSDVTSVTVWGVIVPTRFLFFAIPFGLVYSFARFGFLLSHLIDARRALFAMLVKLGEPTDEGTVSIEPTHRDLGLVDLFMRLKHPNETAWTNAGATKQDRVHFVFYVLFSAAVNAALVGTTLNGLRAFQNSAAWVRLACLVCVLAAMAWVTLTQAGFAKRQRTQRIQSLSMIPMTALILLFVYVGSR